MQLKQQLHSSDAATLENVASAMWLRLQPNSGSVLRQTTGFLIPDAAKAAATFL